MFYQLASLAFYYGLTDILDSLVDSMLTATRLCTGNETARTASFIDGWTTFEAQDEFDFQVQRSKFLQWLGKSFKSQVAMLVVFKVLNEFGDGIERCWNKVPAFLFTYVYLMLVF